MGIPPFKTDEQRVLNKLPNSDVVEIIQDKVANSREEEENLGVVSYHEVEQHAQKWAKSTTSSLSRQG